MAFFLHFFSDIVGDGTHLRGIGTVTDDKEVRDGAIHLTEVERDYVLSFLIQDGVGNQPKVMCNHIGLFCKFAVQRYTKSEPMENMIRIKWFGSLDSTNNELLRHLSDYDNLSVVAAVEQFAGRGQRGNRWLSRPGENLTFSLLLRPADLPAKDLMSITFLSTLVIRGWLRAEGVPARIKWPNDIYVGNRKICGMLIENGLEAGRIAWSVIGIGLNLNQTDFPGELVNPTSLKRLTGNDYDPVRVLEGICRLFETFLPRLDSDRAGLHTDYTMDLFQKDILCPYRDLLTGEVFEGTIKGVSTEGRLFVDRDGKTGSYGFKELGYIL